MLYRSLGHYKGSINRTQLLQAASKSFGFIQVLEFQSLGSIIIKF